MEGHARQREQHKQRPEIRKDQDVLDLQEADDEGMKVEPEEEGRKSVPGQREQPVQRPGGKRKEATYVQGIEII